MNVTGTRRVLAALGVGAGLVAAGASFGAQTAPRQLPATPQQQNQPAQPPASQADGQQANRPSGRFANRVANRIERRLDFLHYEIRITPAQQRLWDNFANAVRAEEMQVRDRIAGGPNPNRGPDNPRADNDRRGPPSVVDRLERRQERLANQTARVDRLLGALRPLYTALDAEQKRTADRLMFQQDFNRFGRGNGRFAMNGRSNRSFDRDYR